MAAHPGDQRVEHELLADLEAPFGTPLWQVPRPDPVMPTRRLPAEGLEADLVVVGGGVAGLATAREAAQRRPDWTVVVLEASRVGAWASGRTGGLVLAGTATDEAPGTMDAPEQLARLVEDERINCHLRLAGCYEVSRDPGPPPVAAIDWQDYGRLRAREAVSGGDVDPGRLMGGLWRALLRHGVAVLEGSRVVAIQPARRREYPIVLQVERRPEPWSEYEYQEQAPAADAIPLRRRESRANARGTGVGAAGRSSGFAPQAPHRQSLRGGAGGEAKLPADQAPARVCARYVVLATEAHGVPLSPGWQRAVGQVRARDSFAIATHPVTPNLLAAAGWADQRPFYTTSLPYLWGRTTVDGRIVVGAYLATSSGPGNGAREAAFRCRDLARRLRGLHPAFAGVRVSHAWWGPIAFRPNWEPVFQPLDRGRRVWCMGAFSGHGLALGPLLGRRLAAYLVGDSPALQDLPWVTALL